MKINNNTLECHELARQINKMQQIQECKIAKVISNGNKTQTSSATTLYSNH